MQEICREHDVLFVADEVITGFGRLGQLVRQRAVRARARPDHHGQGADVGLPAARRGDRRAAGGGAVLAAGSAEVFRHGYTYPAHPTACAVGLANLDLIERERLVARVAELEPVLAGKLKPLAGHELVGEVRAGTGLLARGGDRRRGPGGRPGPGRRAWCRRSASAA